MWVEGIPSSIHPIISFLIDQVLSNAKEEVHRPKKKAAYFVLKDDV